MYTYLWSRVAHDINEEETEKKVGNGVVFSVFFAQFTLKCEVKVHPPNGCSHKSSNLRNSETGRQKERQDQ